MDPAEFAGWLLGMGRLSREQIALALAELGEVARRSADVGEGASAEAASSTGTVERRKASRIERDALATIGEGKVERLGCAHCGADEIVGWGRSHGLPRYRCKACGRTFNAATGTGMARLRKKDRWLDQAQAMIEGVSLAKAAERCGVHPTTAYRRPTRQNSRPRGSRPGQAAARRARYPHQQRQRLPFASQRVDAALPRRRDQEPAQLSGLAPRPRSLHRAQSAELDARSPRPRPIPTANAISAMDLW